jgi:hypothetical protein
VLLRSPTLRGVSFCDVMGVFRSLTSPLLGISSCSEMGAVRLLVSSCVASFRLLSPCCQLSLFAGLIVSLAFWGAVVCASLDRASRKFFNSVCTPPLVFVGGFSSSCVNAAVLLWLVQALACWRARLLSAQRGSFSHSLMGAARIVGGLWDGQIFPRCVVSGGAH